MDRIYHHCSYIMKNASQQTDNYLLLLYYTAALNILLYMIIIEVAKGAKAS